MKKLPDDPSARVKLAKQRLVTRLSRIGLQELRGCERQVTLLTWSEAIDMFLLRHKIRAPRRGRLEYLFMILGMRLGRFLDRIIKVVRRR